VNALAEHGNSRSIPTIVDTLYGSPGWYQDKVQVLLGGFGHDFYRFLPQIINRQEREIQALVIYFASFYIADDLKSYLVERFEYMDKDIAYAALEAFARLYHQELSNEKYLTSPDLIIRNKAVKSLSHINTKENLFRLLKLLEDRQVEEHAVYAISTILRNEPRYFQLIVDRFHAEKDDRIKKSLALVLSSRIEYFLTKLLSGDRELVAQLVMEVLQIGKFNGVVGFLNKNRNVELENEIVAILKRLIVRDNNLKREFYTYLNDRIRKKLGGEKIVPEAPAREGKTEKKKITLLYVLLFCSVLIFPVIYYLRHLSVAKLSIIDHLRAYSIDFNYLPVYYSFSANLIYMLILILSLFGFYKQARCWHNKRTDFLFKTRILPSVSIIAPAYNEAGTIIESSNSLLNLKYPDYELIIVNDGSRDGTLNKLISYYELEKIDAIIGGQLKTMPVNGVYKNRYLPKLTVIDKVNGGKADALNTGINISKNDFICSIDADSLLEPDALLKASSLLLDSKEELIAAGGNVLPINGCTVKKGLITKTRIPESNIAKLQMIEYLRAFMAGRMGWAYINCLLIISGAFGLFKKDRLIQIGGYLTVSERYHKDTVGEDMELIVRLRRYMREKRLLYKVEYAHNANCWTEVPEAFSILSRQRDRWQRGLIDVITFHKKMLFNPGYGRVGLISFPYFFIFEMIGPLVEFQGYVMVVLAALLGLINESLALMLFITNILMGILISTASLLYAEREVVNFKIKETFLLIFFAFIENFGFRQIISFFRVMGYISSLTKSKGWGKMERRGFQVGAKQSTPAQ
jgi:cellulose synthase/poly-beta-1,6-N-acetylglucosamine synthase-like glycosyltransferase